MNKKGRVFSGARPTGRQHLGNFLGAIENYVALQKEYDCVYCIVDLHALTTLETTKNLKENTLEMALDWLAAGIDPQESIIFIQSHVPELAELHTILSMVAPLGKLTDLPTFKEKIRKQRFREQMTAYLDKLREQTPVWTVFDPPATEEATRPPADPYGLSPR